VILGVALSALLGNYLFYLLSLEHATPSAAQVVIQIAPLMLVLGGVCVFREHFAPRQWFGLAALIVGLLLFFNRRLSELVRPTEGLGLGVALMIVAAIA